MLRILPFFFHADYSTLVFGVCGVVVVTFFVYGNLFFCPCGIQDQIPFFLLYFFWGGDSLYLLSCFFGGGGCLQLPVYLLLSCLLCLFVCACEGHV